MTAESMTFARVIATPAPIVAVEAPAAVPWAEPSAVDAPSVLVELVKAIAPSEVRAMPVAVAANPARAVVVARSIAIAAATSTLPPEVAALGVEAPESVVPDLAVAKPRCFCT